MVMAEKVLLMLKTPAVAEKTVRMEETKEKHYTIFMIRVRALARL
jgi:hypothetical protein